MKKCMLFKSSLLLMVMIIFTGVTKAQVFNGNLILNSQAAVDAFSYTEVTGYLYIGSYPVVNTSDITDLSALSSLTSVGGVLRIADNPSLTNLNGLSSLTTHNGDLRIESSPITTLSGLSNLTSIGGYLLISQTALTNLNGLSSLVSIGGTLQLTGNTTIANLGGLTSLSSLGGLTINNNPALSNIDLLSSYNSLSGGIFISNNPSLTSLNALSNLSSVGGGFTINNTPLTDLTSLSSLTAIGGGLTISNNASLMNIDGLSSLTTIGGLNIGGNPLLGSLNGFSSLTSIGGGLLISNSPLITDLDGLSSLTFLGGDLFLEQTVITNLDGLSSLNSIGGQLFVAYNTVLTNIDGLSSVTTIGDSATISGNLALTDLDGLSSLTSIGGYLNLYNNPSLASLDGLSNLASIGGYLDISFTAVSNVDGLSSLTAIGGHLVMRNNSALTNLDGLSSLTTVSGDWYGYGLYIRTNPALSGFCGLYTLLNSGGLSSGFLIYDNASNPTEQEIIDGGPCAPPCDIQLNSWTLSDEGCPGANDGYIIINPSCSTCTGIEYSIDGTTYQSSNEFLNVSPGTYTLYARDVGNPDCLSTVNTIINPGYDYEPPAVNCENIEVCLEPGLNVMITPQDVLTSVTDNCGVDENSFDVIPNNFSATGTFNVTVYASDVNGNQGSCNATVTVNLESTSPTTIEADVNDVCTGQTINLTASGGVSGTGADVVWYDGPNGTGNMLGTGSGISVTPSTTTTYYARREGVCNNTADASLTITVGDNTAPVLTVISTPITLWPPNHKYETITMDQLFVSVSDNCATLSIDDVYIESVSSDEPDNGDNDGNTTEDILFAGDDCSSVQLRRERDEYGNGRVYTINLAVDDGNGNTGAANVEVHVPIGNNQSATNDGADHTETCTNSKSSILVNGNLNEIQLVNYPNPFSNKTTIEFSTTDSGRTSLKVYNSVGYLVATLYEGYAEAGQTYKVDFDGSSLSKGMYFYDLQTVNGVHKMKKMILMK